MWAVSTRRYYLDSSSNHTGVQHDAINRSLLNHSLYTTSRFNSKTRAWISVWIWRWWQCIKNSGRHLISIFFERHIFLLLHINLMWSAPCWPHLLSRYSDSLNPFNFNYPNTYRSWLSRVFNHIKLDWFLELLLLQHGLTGKKSAESTVSIQFTKSYPVTLQLDRHLTIRC